MKNNEKYMTDEQFAATGTKYIFVAYANQKAFEQNAYTCGLLLWYNNNLTQYEGQLILQGLASGAAIKYTHPVAVLYAQTSDNKQTILSTCRH